MRVWIGLLAVVVGTLGCNPPCAERAGSYSWKLTARSGDCGDFRETVISVMGNQGQPMAPCTGTIVYSPDTCAVTHDTQCPLPKPDDGKVEVRGVIHWDVSASNGSGVLEYRVTNGDGSQQCQGTYDAKYTRL